MAETTTPDPYYCDKCSHPKGYHTPERGCSMPLNRAGLPASANEDVTVCHCGRPPALLGEDVIKYAEKRLGVTLTHDQKRLLLAVLEVDDR